MPTAVAKSAAWPTRPAFYAPPPSKTAPDFARENRRRIKEVALIAAQRKEAAAAAAVKASPRPSKQYASIGSRIMADLAKPQPLATDGTSDPEKHAPPRPKSAPSVPNFACPKPSGPPGRIATGWAPPPLFYDTTTALQPVDPKSLRNAPTRKPPVPSAASARPSTAGSSIDLVRRNVELSSLTPRTPVKVGSGVPKGAAPMAGVAAAVPGASPSTEPKKSKHHGRVPPYLMDRKLELAAAKEAKELAAAPKECPEGTRILPEAERVRVLALIESGQKEVHAKLDKIPFVVDTFGLKSKHEALRTQLTKLDAAHSAFSRSRVLVLEGAPAPVPVDVSDEPAGAEEEADAAPEEEADELALVVQGEALPTTVLPTAPPAPYAPYALS